MTFVQKIRVLNVDEIDYKVQFLLGPFRLSIKVGLQENSYF